MIDFMTLAQQCAPTVAPETMAAVVNVESHYNPYAIGVVGGQLAQQPKSLNDAVATAHLLERKGLNFSVGMAQINRQHLKTLGHYTYADAFDPCKNLSLGSSILTNCFKQAKVKFPDEQQALQKALSCYYSGNFTQGFKVDPSGKSYVQKVLSSHQNSIVVPEIQSANVSTTHPVVFRDETVIEKENTKPEPEFTEPTLVF